MSRWVSIAFQIVCCVSLGACQAPGSIVAPTAISSPAHTVTSVSTARPSQPPPTKRTISPAQGEPTRAPSATPRPTQPYDPQVFQTLATNLAISWKAQVPAAEIQRQLQAAGWTNSPDYHWLGSATDRTFATADLDGDGQEEWIVSIFMRAGTCYFGYAPNARESGELWIIGQNGLMYRLYAIDDVFWGAPVIVAVDDLTGDGLPDVITRSIGCGAHTAMGAYHVLGYWNSRVASLVAVEGKIELAANFVRAYAKPYRYAWSAKEIAVPTPSSDLVDRTGDGLLDLVLVGGTYGSSGAGDVRERTEVWSWTGSNVELTFVDWAPSTERFHILYDANFAFALGEYARAERLYQRILTDDTLGNRVGFGTSEENRTAAQLFAGFRLALLYLIEGARSNAHQWAEWLEIEYPDQVITRAATMLIDQWIDLARKQDVCLQITEYLRQQSTNSPATGTLSDAGYGNPILREEDVCPLP